MKTEKNTIPCSYHTFVFPFIYDVTRDLFRDFIEENGFAEDSFPNENTDTGCEFGKYRYFNKAMRNAIYSKDFSSSDVVWNYKYAAITPVNKATETKQNGEATLRIYKKDKLDVTLYFNAIRIKLFKYGVGMLIFELENYAIDNKKQVLNEEDINLINEYGRRVFVPFVDNNNSCPLCADNITLSIDGKEPIKIESKLEDMLGGGVDKIQLSPIIRYFLPDDSNTSTLSLKSMTRKLRKMWSGKSWYEPIGDDRMFVNCICNTAAYGDETKDLASIACEWDDESKEYRYLSDSMKKSTAVEGVDNAAARLYKMGFVDSNILTCQNRNMLHDLLKESCYARWAEYQTLNCITEYSMVSIVHNPPDYIISAFLTEYIEMMTLVLAQRAALLALQRDISDTSRQRWKKVDSLYDAYIDMQCALLLPEVTEQQQGIELYSMMQKQLFIPQQMALVEDQIEDAYKNRSGKSNKAREEILFILSLFGLFGISKTIYEIFIAMTGKVLVGIAAVVVFIAFVLPGFYRIWRHKIR